MNEFDLIVRFKSDEDSITLSNYIIDHLFEDKLFDNLQMWDFKRSEVLSILNLRKENAELKAKLNGALDVCNVPEFRINDLEKEKCELLGIIQGKDEVIKQLKEKLKGFESGEVAWQGDMDKTIKQNLELKAQVESLKETLRAIAIDTNEHITHNVAQNELDKWE